MLAGNVEHHTLVPVAIFQGEAQAGEGIAHDVPDWRGCW